MLAYKGRGFYWERFKLDTLRCERNARFLGVSNLVPTRFRGMWRDQLIVGVKIVYREVPNVSVLVEL